MHIDEHIKVLLQLFGDSAEGGDSNAGSNDGGNGGDGGQGSAGDSGDAGKSGGKTFTQDELDAILAKRLARERKAWEQQIEEERKKQQMSVEERLKAEKEEAEKRAQAAQEAANQRLIHAEARVQAVTLGIKPERIAYALKLADLSGVEVDEQGNPDAAAIKSALEAVLNDLPELKGTVVPGKSGSEFQGGGGSVDRNPWSKEHFNLTEQGRLMRENPQLAAQLKREAKGK